MNKQFYIAALPFLSPAFYDKIERILFFRCYPEIRMPFHTTLYYFGKLSDRQQKEVNHWLENLDKTNIPSDVLVEQVDSFQHYGVSTVYFLKLKSDRLTALNCELKMKFSDIHTEVHEFTPHISLFFPKIDLTQKEKKLLDEYFANISTISLKGLYLGSVVDHITEIHNFIPTT